MDRFDLIARRFAGRLAIHDAVRALTYRELAAEVDILGRRLVGLLPPGTAPVGILLDHSGALPIAMLAVLRAGRGYVPLDAGFPGARNRLILAHAGIVALVTDQQHASLAEGLVGPGVPILRMDMAETFAISADLPVSLPDHLAYVIYTSGSTGLPKGVFQSQRNMLFDVMQYCNAVHIAPEDRVSLLYSPSVSGAIRDIYGALLSGASLHVLSLKATSPAGLYAFLKDRAVTIYHSVPIVFRHLAAQMRKGLVLPEVRIVFLAGDRVDRGDVLAFQRLFTWEALLYLGIGATEAATIYAHRFVDFTTALPDGPVPVGRVLPERRLALVDPAGQPVPVNTVGEIVISSLYLALGYWGASAPEWNQVFGDDAATPGMRTYRTGDLGRMDADGLLTFVGRRDRQIKLHGHRIEPHEIEATLSAHPLVDGAAVITRETNGASSLVAYWSGIGEAADSPALRDYLAERLPSFMVPASIIWTAALPVLPNFKIDRRVLQRRDAATRTAAPTSSMADEPDLLSSIIEAFAGVLQRPVTADTDFFAAGGDSFGAAQLAIELECQLGRPVPEGLLALASTPHRVLDLIAAPRPAGEEQLVALNKPHADATGTVLFLSGLDGGFADVRALVQALPDTDRYLGVLDRSLISGRSAETMAAIAAQAVAAIREAGLRGPFRLLGYSFGGRLAFELAHHLAVAGEQVAFLGVIDATPWHTPPDPSCNPVRQARARAAAAHRVPTVHAPMTLFRMIESNIDRPDDYLWHRYASDLRVVPLPGNHVTFQRPYLLPDFLRALDEALAPSRPASRSIDRAEMTDADI